MGFFRKIFSVVLDIFPAKEFQQGRNRIVTTEMKQIWQQTKWLRANILQTVCDLSLTKHYNMQHL